MYTLPIRIITREGSILRRFRRDSITIVHHLNKITPYRITIVDLFPFVHKLFVLSFLVSKLDLDSEITEQVLILNYSSSIISYVYSTPIHYFTTSVRRFRLDTLSGSTALKCSTIRRRKSQKLVSNTVKLVSLNNSFALGNHPNRTFIS